MTFSVVCAGAVASKEEVLVLDRGDETQQAQEQKNEGAKNLTAGTVLIKAPSLNAGGQQGILFGGQQGILDAQFVKTAYF